MAKVKEHYEKEYTYDPVTDTSRWSDEDKFYGVIFKCPGCGWNHELPLSNYRPNGVTEECIQAAKRHHWTFNGSFDSPTFHPSLHWKTGHYVDGTPEADCWLCKRAKQKGYQSSCMICHSWVRDGKIEFLADCTHSYKGQTLELPEIEE